MNSFATSKIRDGQLSQGGGTMVGVFTETRTLTLPLRGRESQA